MTGRYFSPGSVGGASALLLLRNTHVGGRCSDAIEQRAPRTGVEVSSEEVSLMQRMSCNPATGRYGRFS